MKEMNKQILKAVERLTRDTAFRWPPVCSGIYHQPKRPVDKKKK